MAADLPPSLVNTATSAIVRQAEDAKRAETLAKRKAADDERRRREALEAASNKRTPGASQR